MLFSDFLRWWYSDGWREESKRMILRLQNMADFFSFGTIFKTLFAPFRQISANASSGTRIEVLTDKLISRAVGFSVRFFLILAGAVAMVAGVTVGGLLLLIWPVLPLVPPVSVILAILGVVF